MGFDQSSFFNPMTLAGLAIAQGKPIGDALVAGASQSQAYQANQNKLAEDARAAQAKEMMKNMDWSSPDALPSLAKIDPEMALKLGALQAQMAKANQRKTTTVKGKLVDSQTGEVVADYGQEMTPYQQAKLELEAAPKAPAGYSFAQDGASLVPLPGSKAAVAQEQQAQASQQAVESANNTLGLIEKLKTHPGLETSVGGKGLTGGLLGGWVMPGTDAADFHALLDQVKGGTFMQAYQGLKGAGQITEVEGKKAENAIARLSTAQSETEFKKALGEYEGVIRAGLVRQQSFAGTKFGGGVGLSAAPGMPSPPAANGGVKFLGFE